LSIERSQPKVKPRRPKFIPPLPEILTDIHSTSDGKAGKSHYIVQVGDINDLYKTSKPRRGGPSSSMPRAITIDLHGFTKAEAVELLNENLPQWNGIAMGGSYPFVIPIEIICGCGNQVLSEAVEQWIKQKENVCNCPKNLLLSQQS